MRTAALDCTSQLSLSARPTTTARKCSRTCPRMWSIDINSASIFNSTTGTYSSRTLRGTTRARSIRTGSASTARRGMGICTTTAQWHTWLVGGLGGGGSDIYALDVTNPGIGTGAATSRKRTPRASSSASGQHAHLRGHRKPAHLQLDAVPAAPRISPARTSEPAATVSARPTAFRRSAASTIRP